MGTTSEIGIRRGPDEIAPVPLWTMAEGLAVTEPEPGRFSVTHVRSGLRVWPAHEHQRPHTFDTALRAWAVALECGVDWTQDAGAILASHAADLPAIRARLQLVAFPPQRPRWHGRRRKVRVRPWVAAHRAAALREAIRAGLHSSLGNFLDQTRWREEFHSTALIRPRRQGCTRFVARAAARRGELRRMARRAHRIIADNARRSGAAEDRVTGYGHITWDARGRVVATKPYE